MVTCIAQQYCSQDKCLKGLSVSPFQPSQAGRSYLGLKIFLYDIFSKENFKKTCMLKGVTPSLTTLAIQWRGVCLCLLHSPLAGWVAVTRAGQTLGPPRTNLYGLPIWVRSWLKHCREAVWKSSHEKHVKKPVLTQTTWQGLNSAI